jgi:citrate lyase subunit beta/citryl-CoA lyase
MSLAVLHARAQGIDAIDATFNRIDDAAGFADSCALGRAFGFDGKTLIHPSQIEAANRIFSPSREEIERARRILAAFAQNPGKSVLAFEGKMVERLHAEEASRLLALAQAIERRC